MSSDATAIRVRDLSKHYLMFARPEDRLKQSIVPRLQRLAGRPPTRYYRDFTALSGVSFEVKRGETVGIVGRNGCGKSTLLQIVCGILQPSSGTVEVDGRIAALLELGAGFNPEFTGRENVYLNGAILGLSTAELDQRFDSIARFADIGAFIEHPVKTYSSGMYVRLAFAIAVNVDPDILVVDEALAVGDEAFQRKCFARIEDIKDKGGTILFVSHGAQTIVQLCDRAMLIDRGEKILEGPPKMVVSQYQRLVNVAGDEAEPVRSTIKAMVASTTEAMDDQSAQASPAELDGDRAGVTGVAIDRDMEEEALFDSRLISQSRLEYESRGALIRDTRLTTLFGAPVNILETGKKYIYAYEVDFEESCLDVAFGMGILTTAGFSLGGANTVFRPDRRIPHVPAKARYRVTFEIPCILLPGTYVINSGITGMTRDGRAYLHRIADAVVFRVVDATADTAGGIVDFGIHLNATRLDAQ